MAASIDPAEFKELRDEVSRLRHKLDEQFELTKKLVDSNSTLVKHIALITQEKETLLKDKEAMQSELQSLRSQKSYAEATSKSARSVSAL